MINPFEQNRTTRAALLACLFLVLDGIGRT
jgi:hypothetical protein